MKKFIILLTAFIFSATTVFASGAEEITEALLNSISVLSAQVDMESSIELKKPLLFLDSISELVSDENIDIDFRALIESIIKSRSHVECAYSMSNDFKKISVGMSSEQDMPVTVNDSLKINAWTKTKMWVDYDVSDAENPVYRIIIKSPILKKYTVLESSDEIPQSENISMTADDISKYGKSIVNSLMENAELTVSGDVYTLKMDDAAAKKYILDALYALNELDSYSIPDTDFNDIIDSLKKLFDNMTVFGNEGITIQYKITPDGFISVEEADVHICVNLYDILTLFSKNTNGLSREDSDIDFVLKIKQTITNHNKAIAPDIPEITEENSDISLKHIDNSTMVYKSPIFKNNRAYYPLKKFFDKHNFEVINEDGKITVKSPDDITLVLSENETAAFSNDKEISFEQIPVIIDGDEIYLLGEALDYLYIEANILNYDSARNVFPVSFYYSPPRKHEEETTEPETPKYVPRYLSFSFYLPRMTYIRDDQFYMPVYEFLTMISPGSFTFGNKSLEYTADKENSVGLISFSAHDGDDYVIFNGENTAIDGIVTEYKGVLYIPLSFANNMGISSSVQAFISDFNCSMRFSFSMPNPDFDNNNPYSAYPYGRPSKTLNYYFLSDRVPYVDDDVVYMPAYDFFAKLFDGEFSFDGDLMTYTASDENSFGIKSISVCTGDDFVTVDGEKIKLEKAATIVDDVIRIPVSFADELGLKTNYISANSYGSYSSSSYSFSKDNPDYVPNENSYESKYDNWFYDLF